jgi:hypothetical protein
MTSKLLALAQLITRTNQIFIGIEGILFGVILFSSIFVFLQHRARREARIL